MGTQFDRDGKTISETDASDRMRDSENDLVNTYGGFTRWQGVGGYRYADGTIVTEPCTIFEVFSEGGPLQIRGTAHYLKLVWHQESVCVVGPDGAVEFIS